MKSLCLLLAIVVAMSRGELLPIFMMHGVGGSYHDFDRMQKWIAEIDPDAVTENLQLYDLAFSFQNLWTQQQGIIDAIREKVRATPDVYSNGYVLLCHSQGALLCRTVVQMMDDHLVHTFISLAGPHMGEFGIPGIFQKVVPWGRDLAWKFFFTEASQGHLSVADYWNDPRPEPRVKYLAGNTFLTVFNNEPNRSSQGPGLARNDTDAARLKANLLRVERVVLCMGGIDDTIIPRESSHFEMYSEDVSGVVPLEQSLLWTEDWLGLRTLHMRGGLVRITEPSANHMTWQQDEAVFRKHILPQLPHVPPMSSASRRQLVV